MPATPHTVGHDATAPVPYVAADDTCRRTLFPNAELHMMVMKASSSSASPPRGGGDLLGMEEEERVAPNAPRRARAQTFRAVGTAQSEGSVRHIVF